MKTCPECHRRAREVVKGQVLGDCMDEHGNECLEAQVAQRDAKIARQQDIIALGDAAFARLQEEVTRLQAENDRLKGRG